METDGKVSLVLFSGTDDKLQAAAVLVAGAAAMGRTVDVLLQFWALDAFRADRIRKDHGAAGEAGPEGLAAMQRQNGLHWSEVIAQVRQIGEVFIHACAQSMEMLDITKDDLDPLVDDVEGVAAFMSDATGSITFI
ncbi:MAG TPA: DsrE/DsrF/DrsH-like family protein [Actinomycetota bacterium]|nr:DsrE/DsrF/DrsH-like family protein [Actinomycetota bacterium]